MAVTIDGTNGITTPGLDNTEGYTGDGLSIAAGAPSGAVTVASGGNVGIGTSSPGERLQVNGNISQRGDNTRLFSYATDGTIISEQGNGSITGNPLTYGITTRGAFPLLFGTNNAERLRIDASGNVGIGTSTNNVFDQVAAARPLLVQSASSSTTVAGSSNAITICNSDTTTSNSSQLNFAAITGASTNQFSPAVISAIHGARTNDQYPSGQLVFSVAGGSNTAPTERMRVDSSGNLLVGTTSTISGARVVIQKSNSERVVHAENTRNISGDQVYRSWLGSNCNDTVSYHIVCTTGGPDRFYVYGNGNVVNSNNSYGSLSDIKLKENVVDATPKLEKLNQVRVVNYNLKDQPNQKLLGVVAQELEQIFPGMVDETPDKDKDGNLTGETTKSVKYSVFVPMLIKAIQELNAKVDAQAAEIAALKGQA